jgi:hypothetical protein
LGHEAMMEKEQFMDFGIPSSPYMDGLRRIRLEVKRMKRV